MMAGVFSKVFLHVSIEKRSNHKRREIMMENNELLQAISNMMDQKLDPVKNEIQDMKGEIQTIKGEVQTMKGEIQDMKGEIQTIKEDQAAMKSELQMQIKRTEQNLRTEIRESENLILQEVSRVHHILNDHIGNQNVHTA
jgi:peptidoglycan hydrolase CwlO-like protein